MARVRAETLVPGPVSAAEALWHDLRRWPSFVDGLARVDKQEGAWPEPGARVIWSGPPGGRARMVERSIRLLVREGHVVEVEDDRLRGTRSIAFAPDRDGLVRVTLELEFAAKTGEGGQGLLGRALLGRREREALERTLARFRIERMADVDDGL
jgi:hypothetical protein